MMQNTLLEVDNLRTYFYTDEGVVRAVDGATFMVERGCTLGIVGESGCGKTITALSTLQLVPQPRGRIAGGRITYYRAGAKSIDITALHPHSRKMRGIRGNEIAMIFQEPMSSLNPVFSIGEQIMETVRLHQKVGQALARERAVEMLDRVGISAPEQRIYEYPHQFSGGMRQRAMIAMALSCDPSLLIADEPTTALDVTIEAQILELMKDLQKDLGMSIVIITHDLGVIGEMTSRVLVMYTGKVVEHASTDDIFYSARHPYTAGLLKSIPRIGKNKQLVPIRGSVPNMAALPAGCYFEPRCPQAMDICSKQEPGLYEAGAEHHVKCWLHKS